MPAPNPNTSVNARVIVRGLLLIAVIFGLFALLRYSGVAFGPDELKAWVDEEVRERGPGGVLLFVVAGAVFTGVGLSRQALAFVAGYAFGSLAGAMLSLIAEMGGVVLAFSFARYVGRDAVARRYAGSIGRFDEFLRNNPFLMTVAVKLFPLGSNVVLNVLAGVSSVGLRPYLLGSAVGHAPQTVIFAMVAAGVATGDKLQSLLAVVLFVLSGLLGVYLYGRYRRGLELDGASGSILEGGRRNTDDAR